MTKTWTLLVYMAADNDLAPQAARDLEEMLAIGSSPDVAVLDRLFAIDAVDSTPECLPATSRRTT